MFEFLLTLSLALPAQDAERFPPGFPEWLMASRGEVHLAQYTQHELLLASGRRADLVPSAEEVENALSEQITSRVENAHAGDPEAWIAELARLGLDEENWRDEQRARTTNSLLVERLVRVRRQISDPELVTAWEERFGPGGHATTVRWIQVQVIAPPTPPGATRDEERALREAAREAARTRAEEVCDAWRAGAEFSSLRRSVGQGDEPEEPFRLDDLVWPEAARRSVAELGLGEISAPIAARGGWSLIQLLSSEHTPLEEVREGLLVELASRPANSAETEALFRELAAIEEPSATLPLAAFEVDPLSSTLVIGRVAQRPILLSTFARWLLETRGRPHLVTFTRVLLVERLARAQRVTFTSLEVVQRRESDLQDRVDLFYGGDRSRWLDDLRMDRHTLSGWRREADLRAHHDLCAEELLLARRVVSDQEIHAEWEEQFGPGGIARTVRWILLTPPQPPEELQSDGLSDWLDKELEALSLRAKDLRRRIVEDGEDFATLARLHSADSRTRAEGGLFPGVFDPRTEATVIASAVEPLNAGEVSQPVRLVAGCAIYQVHKIVHTPLSEVEAELESALLTRRPSAVELAGFVNQLYEESKR